LAGGTILPARFWLIVGALLGGFSVAAGAAGAHLLKDRLASADLANFEIAARYQMYHALALVLVGALRLSHRSRWLEAAGWAFLLGVTVFCGCLYLLAWGGPRWLGAVVPIGGLAMIVGWAALAMAAFFTRSAETP
jgi:uncharacterized membrane protein YgdD (TMEM256/DUF423 family)